MIWNRQLGRWILTATQIVVTIGLLLWLVSKLNFVVTFEQIARINPVLFAICSFMLSVLVIPAAIRWRWFISRFLQSNLPLPTTGEAVRISAVNVALNQFLPSTLGGDLYRVVIARTLGLPVITGIFATAGDRLSAFVILVLISGPAMLFVMVSANHPLMTFLKDVTLILGGGLALVVITVFSARGSLIFQTVAQPFRVVFDTFRANGAVFHVFFTSLLIQTTTLLVMILIARAMGVDIGFTVLAGIMAASLLASRLPISIAGWGVREGLSVSLFGAFGVTAETAIATSVLYGLAELTAAILALLVASTTTMVIKFSVK